MPRPEPAFVPVLARARAAVELPGEPNSRLHRLWESPSSDTIWLRGESNDEQGICVGRCVSKRRTSAGYKADEWVCYSDSDVGLCRRILEDYESPCRMLLSLVFVVALFALSANRYQTKDIHLRPSALPKPIVSVGNKDQLVKLNRGLTIACGIVSTRYERWSSKNFVGRLIYLKVH